MRWNRGQHYHCDYRERGGFWRNLGNLILIVVAVAILWNVIGGYFQKKSEERRRVTIEKFLRTHLSADSYADYILIRDGVKKQREFEF